MDISFSSMFFHDSSLDDIFRAPGYCHADSLEFWLETPDFWLKGLKQDELIALIERYRTSCPLSVHAPVLDLNPCSINPDVRDVSIKWIERSILLAETMGASVCTIHPGRRTAKRAPSITDYQRLGYMLDVVEPLAETVHVKVAIENMEPAVNALLTSPDEIMNILNGRPWLWFTLDIAHAMKCGFTCSEEFMKSCKEKIVNIHISGSNGEIMHGLVTSDPVTISFLSTIKKSGYDGKVTLELNDLMLSKSLNYQEKIQIVKGEIFFLQKHLQ